MDFNDDVSLDTSQVQDTRGAGGGMGGRVALGGGGLGIVGLILYFVLSQFGGGVGGGSGLPLTDGGLGSNEAADSGKLARECRTGRDANSNHDCALVAIINSVQGYWGDQLSRSGKTYKVVPTIFFTGNVDTGCGGATADVGPFYCPADKKVYIDLSFFEELKTRFGAQGGTFVEAYVLAHEYGHHVQDLLGRSAQVDRGTGPTSGSVRLELQADCYAGVWANHATTSPTANGGPLIRNITDDDINRALDAASRIGDDYIQSHLGGGSVDESKFSHGSSQQREKWFTTGFRSGQPSACDTFGASDLG